MIEVLPIPRGPSTAVLPVDPENPDPERWHREWRSWWGGYALVVSWAAGILFCSGAETVPAPYLYQAEPNLRIQRPGEVCVPWHTDAEFGHLPEEWNVWIPLTEMTDDTQRLWIDRGEEETVEPVDVPLGHALFFQGAKVRHGNKVNETEVTRVSFDFRLIAKKHYRDTGAVTVTFGVPLCLGDYWREAP